MLGENAKAARELRAQGKTYQSIADELNISRQRVGQICGKYNPRYFRTISEKGCVYPALRKWRNENMISNNEMCRRFFGNSSQANVVRLNEKQAGRKELKKRDIDKLLEITGMKYEELFAKE